MKIDLTKFEQGNPFKGDPDATLASLQERLARVQVAQIVHRRRVLVLLDGWIGSGKKAALRRLIASLDPVHVNVITAEQTDDERHWLAPFWSSLPSAGNISIFYRSWYYRMIEERINGSTDDKRWSRACDEVNEFEAQQCDHGTLVVKLFFHVAADRQMERLRERHEDKWVRHLLSEEHFAGLGQRDQIIDALHDLFKLTDTRWAPWHVIDGNDERASNIAALTAIVGQFEKAMPAEPPQEGETVVHFPQLKRG